MTLREALKYVAEAETPSMEFHPLTAAIRLMTEREYTPFLRSIRRDGLLHPIVILSDGSIIDGRCRYLACVEAGVEPRTVAYEGSEDWESLKEYIIAMNVVRCHRTEEERLEMLEKMRAYLVEKEGSAPAWIDEDIADFE